MAQIRKMECQVEVKSPADKFYDTFKSKIQLMPKMCSQFISDVKLLQGEWDSPGAVRLWTYVIGGKTEIVKDTLEHVDDENKTLVLRTLEGDVLNSYKSWTGTLTFEPKSEGSLVKLSLEYEKQNENIPDPVMYIDFFNLWTKNIDAYLLSA